MIALQTFELAHVKPSVSTGRSCVKLIYQKRTIPFLLAAFCCCTSHFTIVEKIKAEEPRLPGAVPHNQSSINIYGIYITYT